MVIKLIMHRQLTANNVYKLCLAHNGYDLIIRTHNTTAMKERRKKVHCTRSQVQLKYNGNPNQDYTSKQKTAQNKLKQKKNDLRYNEWRASRQRF